MSRHRNALLRVVPAVSPEPSLTPECAGRFEAQGFKPMVGLGAISVQDQQLTFHGPDGAAEGRNIKYAASLYRRLLGDLEDALLKADLRDPQEFHGLLWMMASYLKDLSPIAHEQMVDMETVRRWLRGRVTPPALRRRGILASALVALKRELEQAAPPPFQQYERKGAFPRRAKGFASVEVI